MLIIFALYWQKDVFFVSFCVGHRILTIQGSNLGGQANDSVVFVGGEECVTVQRAATNITCLLPVLPPGLYKVHVQVGNNGYPRARYGCCERHFHTERLGDALTVCQRSTWKSADIIAGQFWIFLSFVWKKLHMSFCFTLCEESDATMDLKT